MVPCALGTDTGGSVRIPAAWCGITGLKTTIGRISTYGVLPLSPTLDTPGPLTRSVEDAAVLLQVMQGADPRDPRTQALGKTHMVEFAYGGWGTNPLRVRGPGVSSVGLRGRTP